MKIIKWSSQNHGKLCRKKLVITIENWNNENFKAINFENDPIDAISHLNWRILAFCHREWWGRCPRSNCSDGVDRWRSDSWWFRRRIDPHWTDWSPNRWGTTGRRSHPSEWTPYTLHLQVQFNSILKLRIISIVVHWINSSIHSTSLANIYVILMNNMFT